MRPLEAALRSEPRLGDGMTFGLLLHLFPLLTSQGEIQVLGGDDCTDDVLGNLHTRRTVPNQTPGRDLLRYKAQVEHGTICESARPSSNMLMLVSCAAIMLMH